MQRALQLRTHVLPDEAREFCFQPGTVSARSQQDVSDEIIAKPCCFPACRQAGHRKKEIESEMGLDRNVFHHGRDLIWHAFVISSVCPTTLVRLKYFLAVCSVITTD